MPSVLCMCVSVCAQSSHPGVGEHVAPTEAAALFATHSVKGCLLPTMMMVHGSFVCAAVCCWLAQTVS